MKKIVLAFFLCLSLILLGVSIGFADPSHLVVVRASNSTLWAMTCNGTSCSAWTSISGTFASQPTLIWDEDTQRYYLYGVSSANTIWRSSFNADGSYNNDWAQIGGSTPSPVAATGGGLNSNFSAYNSVDMTSYVTLDTTIANLKSASCYCPTAGFIQATGSGSVNHYNKVAGNTAYSRIYLSTTSGGDQVAWSFTDVPSVVAGQISFPFATTRWFSCSASVDTPIYLTGQGYDYSGGSVRVYNASISLVYYPYSY